MACGPQGDKGCAIVKYLQIEMLEPYCGDGKQLRDQRLDLIDSHNASDEMSTPIGDGGYGWEI